MKSGDIGLEAIEAAILKRALGYRIKEIVPLEIDGEVVRVEVEREIPPDTLACWLWLRTFNRRNGLHR